MKNIFKQPLTKTFPFLLVIGGFIGLLSAYIITVEKIELIKNPNFRPSCEINPLLSCGSIMDTPQAEIFGFPNPLLGLVGFAVVITVGMALIAGAKFKRWFWLGLQAGTIFGVVFVHWLFYQSLYNIGALCLYCMIVWTVTIPIFWYTTLYNLREKHIKLPKKYTDVVSFAQKHHADILIVWYVILIALILHNFWFYWSSLI